MVAEGALRAAVRPSVVSSVKGRRKFKCGAQVASDTIIIRATLRSGSHNAWIQTALLLLNGWPCYLQT